jgi:cytochrome c biogenesis protein CcdA
VALVIGAINIKDFIWFRRGISLSISDAAKPALYQRARRLLRADSLSTLLLATAGLALFANLYEFLCTAGFPMVYTRILTLVALPEWQYYAYLALYNLVYILPLLTIVVLFAWGMGGRKLQEKEGRRLKLVSGVMMAALGMLLLVAPDLLQNLAVAGTLLVTALLISAVLIHMENKLSAGQ